MESPYFPVGFRQLPGHITIEELKDSAFFIGPVEVKTIFLDHPGVCVGYRLNTSGGTIAYLPDNEPYQRYKFHTGQPESAGSAEFLRYARRMDERLANFIRGAEVLILDAQYDLNEYQARVGWGHGCVDDAVALAAQAEVKRLFLFHHDPSHGGEKITRMATGAAPSWPPCANPCKWTPPARAWPWSWNRDRSKAVRLGGRRSLQAAGLDLPGNILPQKHLSRHARRRG